MSAEAQSHSPPMLVFADDWGRHPSSCQHLVRQLLPRRDVVWVNTIGTRPPRLDRATVVRGLGKLRQWTRPERALAPESANLRVLSPRMWPWFRSTLDRRLNAGLLTRQLSPVIQALPERPIAITTIPLVADLMQTLPVAHWVYYCVDDFSQWPGLDSATLERMERDVIAQAGTLVAVSEALRARIRRLGRQAELLTHGVDLDDWSVTEGPPLPAIADLERPFVVFWGVVDRRMDVTYVKTLANDLAAGTILLVGPRDNPDPILQTLPRVATLPPISYRDLPRLARDSAVLVMPYDHMPVTRAMQPLKLKEYMATGKPVIVSNLESCKEWSDCLDIATTPESFSRLVRLRIETGLPTRQGEARARLASERWSEKALRFERLTSIHARKAERSVEASS